MNCPHCQTNNPPAMKFCGACGGSLSIARCEACSFENPPGFSFCGQCGAPLTTSGSGTPARLPAESLSDDAERRQLTVLFCDLVGSTAIASRLDPEDLSGLINTYQSLCARVVERFDGHVAQYLGDGVLAYFGYPRAHEDDAERAVRVGFGIIDATAVLSAEGRWGEDIVLEVRLGIATGLVVTGDLDRTGGTEESSAVGQTLNLAARLQAVARPNSIVIAPETQRLIGGLFEYEDLGRHELKGFAEPVQAWQVVRPKQAASRFEASHAAGMTPLVDRTEEVGALQQCWERAIQGEGQVVLLCGEPGIGKSRITDALRERIATVSHTRLRYQCSPYYSSSPLYPVIANLVRLANFSRGDTADAKLDKLEALLAQPRHRVAEIAPLLAGMLSVPTGERYPPVAMTGRQRKEKTLEVLVDQVQAISAERPVLLVFEDVHWIDPTSRELLDLIVDRIRNLPVLVVITFRPEFSASWADLPHATFVALNRLERSYGVTMVGEVTGGKPLPAAVLEQIVEKTDGVPLFVEELTKTMLESGLLRELDDSYELSGPLPPFAVPTTLKDSLMARLDQLAPVKRIAQIGAAIGREFTYELIAAVSQLPERELVDALDQLVDSELVFRRGDPPSVVYTFKHALVQDAAYESMLRSRRQVLHAQIADVLEARFPELTRDNPELQGHHYSEAGIAEKAVDYWLQAGRRASERSANIEAVSHLEKGVENVKQLPDTEQGKERELTLLIALGPALITTAGPGTPQVERTYTRALELCSQLPESPLHFAAMWGWSRIFDNFEVKRERADKLLQLADNLGDPGLRLQAHHSLWASLFHLGHHEECCHHIDAGLAYYDVQEHRNHAAIYGGHDPRVCGHGETGLALWLLGFPQRGLQRIDEALSGAAKLKQSGSIVHAMDIACMFHKYRRDAAAVLERAEAMIAFTRENGFVDHTAKGIVFRGWALAKLGDLEHGFEALCQGIEAERAIGTKEDFPVFFDMLAELHGMRGEAERGLHELEEAFSEAERTGLRYWGAELLRRKGELLLQHSAAAASDVEACFGSALEIARTQNARSLELRVATSLARLMADQDRGDEARDLLAPIYAWFVEGFDTLDLKEARQLLDRLARTSHQDGSGSG